MRIQKKSRFVLFVTMLLIQSALMARVLLTGTIINRETGQSIPDANITVLHTGRGTSSRDGGYYFLEDLPAGKYKIKVSVIGYASVVRDVSVPQQKTLDFALEPRAIEYDPVVVTATLSEHRQSNVTASVDVLTKSRLQELNGNTTGEMIKSIRGVYTKSYDGLAGLNTPSIRGSEPSQVLVLMDGLRLNTGQGGGVDLNVIPLAAIERIEIIKGGHSALLGSDAIGGAIHLISNDMLTLKQFHYSAKTTLGSFGTRLLTLNGAHHIGSVTLFAGYNRTQSDGDFKYRAPESGELKTRVNNDSRTDNIFLKGKFAIDEQNTFQMVYHRLQTEQGIAGNVNISEWTGLPQTTPKARSDSKRNALKIESDNQLTPRLLLKEQIGYHTYDYHYVNPESWIPEDDCHKNTALSADIQGLYTVTGNVTASGGMSIQKDDLSSTKFKNVNSRIMKSLFGQIELKHNLSISRWTWIPAVRWDDYNDVGSRSSPKMGVMVTVGNNADAALKGNIGKSYHVPTFNDLYWPSDEYTAGNPDLVPETGTNFDVGVRFLNYTNGLVQAEVTYFSNTIKNLIVWQSGSDYIWRPVNIGRAEISGIESGLNFRLPSEIAYVNIYYTKMKALDKTDGSGNRGNRLIYRPDNKWDILLGAKLGPVGTSLNYRIVGKSYTTADNSKHLDGYRILDANIRTSLSISGFSFHMRLQGLNLTDRKIFINDGYPLPGRAYRITMGIDY
ncbi:TonB-dependent receptor [bacterium]|nr:TonB-dependent receptor [bacterium]